MLLHPAATGPRRDRTGRSWSDLPHRLCRAALVLTALMVPAIPRTNASAAVPEGVWRIDGKAAVQIFNCDGLLCGRILWLRTSRGPQGQLNRDQHNPNPTLRPRRLFTRTILGGLRSSGPNRWDGGWNYNPEDGRTYNVAAELRAADLIVARIYSGCRIISRTKSLLRVPRGT